MMNKIKFFIVVVVALIMSVGANAQQTKPKFKTITLVAYHPVLNGSGKAVFYVMDYSIRFYENDSLHYTANNYTPIKPFEEPKKFRFGMSDTTYRIPGSLTSGINKIFDGKT